MERGRGVTVFGGVMLEVVRGGVGDSLIVCLGVVDLDDTGVKEVELEAIGFVGTETVLFAVELGGVLFELMFQGGRGGGVFFPFKGVVCGGLNGVIVFSGVLTVVLRASVPFGGGGGGRLGAGTVAGRLAPN